MDTKQNKLISMMIGIIIIVLFVLALLWLSNSTFFSRSNLDQNVDEERRAEILKELSKPALDANGKPVPPPTAAERATIIAELTKQNEERSLNEGERVKILEELQKPSR